MLGYGLYSKRYSYENPGLLAGMLRLLTPPARLEPSHLPPTSHLQPERVKLVAHDEIEVRIVLLDPASDLPLINHVCNLLDPCPDLALRPARARDTSFFSTLCDTARTLREAGHKVFDGLVHILAPPELRGGMQDQQVYSLDVLDSTQVSDKDG